MSKSRGRKLAEWMRNLNANQKADTDGIADLAVTFDKLDTALVVTESDAIGSNDNDTTIATSAAIVDYVATNTPATYGDSDVATYISGNRTYGNITTTGYIAGPSTFTIDPAAVGDNTGTLVVAGNLQVDGTTTTINSTTMTVDDINITLASGAANAAAANGAGITIDGPSIPASLTYDGTNDTWGFNKALVINTDTTNETYGPSNGGSVGLTIADAATDSDSICSIKFNSRDAGDNNRHFASIAAQKTGQWADGGGSYPGALTFWTRPTSGNQAERMRIDKDGKVRVNTTNTNAVGMFQVKQGTNANLVISNVGTGGIGIAGINDVASSNVPLGYNASQHEFQTGGTDRMLINNSGDLIPGANGTQNIGSSSLRWGTVYTSDLSLKNENGDWTIVEGEDDLFLYNNKKNKVYKFALTEVDPATAPAKKV